MCSGTEDHGHFFFDLAGHDIFVELRDMVLLTAKLQTHICMGTTCTEKKVFVTEQMPTQRKLLGEHLLCSPRDTEFLDRMLTTLGGTWNLVLWLSPSNQKVAAPLLSFQMPQEGCLNFWLQVLFCGWSSIGLFTKDGQVKHYENGSAPSLSSFLKKRNTIFLYLVFCPHSMNVRSECLCPLSQY